MTTRITGCSLAVLAASLVSAPAQAWLDQVDEALAFQTKDGFFRTELSGLLDVEGYYIDQRPPGLLFDDKGGLFSPRLSLFLDTQIGKHLYSLVQFRADRGFDPGSRKDGDARLDEYLLRYTPLDDPRINFQAGKFATVFGNWVPRHSSWDNPFINAPLPYENVLVMTDHAVPPGPGPFLARRNRQDQKGIWLPVIWGPSYASGGSVFGAIDRFDYAFEVKNASLSSRPSVWDATRLNWDYPTVSGRVGYRPSEEWTVGASFSHGTYLLPQADATLPIGRDRGDYNQITVGQDIGFSRGHWQVWAEVMATRFEVPNVGDADTILYYVEAKYKFTSQFFGALRWNQQFFDKVNDGTGGQQRWDRDLWRAEAALGFRFNRHWQTKAQYSFSQQNGPFQQGEQLVAAQVTLKF